MRAVGLEVLTSPNQSVATHEQSVGPVIQSPVDPRRLDRSVGGIVVQGSQAIQLVLYGPLHGEAGLVGVRFGISWIERAIRVSGVEPASEIRQLYIRELCVQVLS